MIGHDRRLMLGLLRGAAVTGSVVAPSAAEERTDPAAYLTQQQLRERGALKIDRVGEFEIRSTESRRPTEQPCSVHLGSL